MRTGVLLASLFVGTGIAQAQLHVEVIGLNYLPRDVSADGLVVTGEYYGTGETFYWTSDTGPLPLGRSTAHLGAGGGTQGISADGTKISATISTDDDLHITQGRWSITSGWQTLMPPAPPDGGLFDNSYGTAWGMSGDGETVVGLYWRPGGSGDSAHACYWTSATGVVDLGSLGRGSRANAASHDGSVIGGWVASPTDGTWQPVVWVNEVLSPLGTYDAGGYVAGINHDGTIVVGRSYTHPNSGGTIWRWNGSSWDEQYIGVLPGTAALHGLSWFDGVSADGELVVGANRPAFTPSYWGMLWTPDTGLIDADDWVAGMGASTSFPISQLTAVSDDGRTVVGMMTNDQPPYELVGIKLRCASDGDADGNGDVDLRDFALLQRLYTGAGAGAIPPGSEPLDANCDLDIDHDDVEAFVGWLSGPAG